jgi:hypothetical protein
MHYRVSVLLLTTSSTHCLLTRAVLSKRMLRAITATCAMRVLSRSVTSTCFASNMLCRPDTVVLMAHRHRHPEDHVFFDALQVLFDVQDIPVTSIDSDLTATSTADGAQQAAHTDVRLLRLIKKL